MIAALRALSPTGWLAMAGTAALLTGGGYIKGQIDGRAIATEKHQKATLAVDRIRVIGPLGERPQCGIPARVSELVAAGGSAEIGQAVVARVDFPGQEGVPADPCDTVFPTQPAQNAQRFLRVVLGLFKVEFETGFFTTLGAARGF